MMKAWMSDGLTQGMLFCMSFTATNEVAQPKFAISCLQKGS